jgi:hypothetical protein
MINPRKLLQKIERLLAGHSLSAIPAFPVIRYFVRTLSRKILHRQLACLFYKINVALFALLYERKYILG